MGSEQRKGKADRELSAIGAILGALDGLDGESIQRVLDYVFDRLSIARLGTKPVPTVVSAGSPPVHSSREPVTSTRQMSIRDLKEEKTPSSANQMAALVAYYLTEIAPEDERKEAINASDLEKYFKQASFKLPKAIAQALPNAAAAGYFDPSGNGMYKLNPVGYNLVVHGLPRVHGLTGSPRRSRKKVAAKRSGRR